MIRDGKIEDGKTIIGFLDLDAVYEVGHMQEGSSHGDTCKWNVRSKVGLSGA